MKWLLLVMVGSVVLYGLHRLGTWAEEHGWIYYRKRHGSSGTLSTAVLEVQSLLEPSKRHVLEELEREQVDEDVKGEPPSPGEDGRRRTRG